MPSKLSVLLDTSIIVEAHVHGVWSTMTKRLSLIIPSTIIGEADFYEVPGTTLPEDVGKPLSERSTLTRRIDLSPELADGTICEAEVTVTQIARLRAQFDRDFLQRIHDGERDALALLYDGAFPDCSFCCSDSGPITGLARLGMSERGISFEALLRSLGIVKKDLRPHFTEQFFRYHLEQGRQHWIAGFRSGSAPPGATSPKAKTQKKPAVKTQKKPTPRRGRRR